MSSQPLASAREMAVLRVFFSPNGPATKRGWGEKQGTDQHGEKEK